MSASAKKQALYNQAVALGFDRPYKKSTADYLQYFITVASSVPNTRRDTSSIPPPPTLPKAVRGEQRSLLDQITNVIQDRDRRKNIREFNESNKPDDYLTKNNKKFSIREWKYYDVEFKVNTVYNLLKNVFNVATLPLRSYYITIYGEMTTKSTDGDGDIDERLYNINYSGGKGIKYKKGETNIRKFVDQFFDEAIERLIKMQKDSKNLVEYDDLFNLRILVKEIKSGGKHIGMKAEYEPFLFNPKTEFTCFIECLKKAGVIFPQSSRATEEEPLCPLGISEIYKRVGKKSIEAVAATQINKFLKVCDSEKKYSVMLYKFKKDGTLPQKGTKYLGESQTGSRVIIHMLLYLDHYMLFTNPLMRSQIKPDGFWEIEDDEGSGLTTSLPLENTILKQDPIKVTKKPEKFEVNTDTWFWDMEALHGEEQHRTLTTKTIVDGEKVNKKMIATEHQVYNVRLCKITDLFEYSSHRHDFLQNHKNKTRMMNSIKIMYGSPSPDGEGGALREFIDFLTDDVEKKHTDYIDNTLFKDGITRDDITYLAKFESLKIKTLRYYQQTFVAYNSGRYDHYLILKNNLATMGLDSILTSNGILNMNMFGYIKFVDFYRHTMCSLAGLCKSFKLPEEYSKSSFPHDFMGVDKLEYVGPAPEAKYWPGQVIPDGIIKDPLNWNLKEFSIYYQKLDVISMGICYLKYCRVMYKITELNAPDYLTTPGLSYAYITHKIQNHDVKIIKDLRTDTWMRNAIIGGRCFIQKRYFKSQRYDEINKVLPNGKTVWDTASQEERKNILNTWCDDGLCDFDGVSLYPSAMSKFEYPVGDAYWVDASPSEHARDGGLVKLLHELNDLEYNKMSIVECDLEFTSKDIVTPLIAEQLGPRRVYTCYDKKNIILSSVDLEEAIKYNKIKITKVHRALEWAEKEYVFKEVIDHLFNERLKAKREGDLSFSTLLKLLMNSGYGKFEQKLITTETKISDSNEFMDSTILSGAMKSFDLLNDDKVILELNKKIGDNSKQFKPVQMGIFILSLREL
eukprot:Lithocolla_globosa_v1_NODE_27_length_9260_cov_179.654861.p1 type:complete len:1023 gc:universal NODE_27_length_9260_cov_179.654861:5430-8498(+)